MKNIGILGGTFDPPHIGHLIAAEQVCEEYHLDKMLFIPASIPPHKRTKMLAPAEHRLAMTQIAIEGNRLFAVSEIELEREGISYTIDTLEQLRVLIPDATFNLLIGMDNLSRFDQWHHKDEVVKLARVIAMLRPSYSNEKIPKSTMENVTIFPIPLIDISSSDIRLRVHEKKSVRYLVPEKVAAYIAEHKLYR